MYAYVCVCGVCVYCYQAHPQPLYKALIARLIPIYKGFKQSYLYR